MSPRPDPGRIKYLAYTAAGVYDGFFEFRLSAWDLAAGSLLIEEAGGRASDLDGGDRFLVGGNLVAGNPAVHREMLSTIAAHADERLLDSLVPNTAPSAPNRTPSSKLTGTNAGQLKNGLPLITSG